MAAARAKARSGEAGAQCHRAPGPPPRPKPRRTARRRCADTLTARRSRPCAGGRRAGVGADRARCGAPRAAVLGDECARGALFKGEQGSTRAAAVAVAVAVATAEPGGAAGVVAGLKRLRSNGPGIAAKRLQTQPRATGNFGGPAGTCGLFLWMLKPGTRSARACALVARPLKV